MKLRPGLIYPKRARYVPSFIGAGAAKTDTTNINNLALPTGHVADDILVLAIETRGDEAQPPTPSGWTLIANVAATTGLASTQTQITVFWKRDNGSESAVNLADPGDHQGAIIMGFRNCLKTASPIDVSATDNRSNNAETAFSFPAVTTTGPRRLVVNIVGVGFDGTSTTEFSGWTNASLVSITEGVDFTDTPGDGTGIGMAYGVKTTAGSSGSTSVTGAHNEKHALVTFALIPLT